jgi:hypothetical protein
MSVDLPLPVCPIIAVKLPSLILVLILKRASYSNGDFGE